jgi:hypothetical protein
LCVSCACAAARLPTPELDAEPTLFQCLPLWHLLLPLPSFSWKGLAPYAPLAPFCAAPLAFCCPTRRVPPPLPSLPLPQGWWPHQQQVVRPCFCAGHRRGVWAGGRNGSGGCSRRPRPPFALHSCSRERRLQSMRGPAGFMAPAAYAAEPTALVSFGVLRAAPCAIQVPPPLPHAHPPHPLAPTHSAYTHACPDTP